MRARNTSGDEYSTYCLYRDAVLLEWINLQILEVRFDFWDMGQKDLPNRALPIYSNICPQLHFFRTCGPHRWHHERATFMHVMVELIVIDRNRRNGFRTTVRCAGIKQTSRWRRKLLKYFDRSRCARFDDAHGAGNRLALKVFDVGEETSPPRAGG